MRTNWDEIASNVSDGACSKVDRERCVRATFMHSAIENYSRPYVSVTTMVGVSRNKNIRNEIAFHDYLA